ncbi:MAG TPA: glycosyl-4,4'-diaponeurosporenoate acyltransferase [Oligoflexia bacterium]|nr:glycosyl-4,4'-diaponeurosporenoate acyltransferase [Oligoflexia bacterium]HMR24877.1 glycosyl-4,4'-diaponeurosporenoate acyltransferase [Oligoflexia bacterium]
MFKFSILLTTFLNIILWPIIHMSISWLITRLPLKHIPAHANLFKPLPFETPTWYKKYLLIKKWKDCLPDAAAWFEHGFAKATLKSSEEAYLKRFFIETTRGELAHWLTMAFTPLFYLWNPIWACIVMTSYALVANVPCILIQRYNRLRIKKILKI